MIKNYRNALLAAAVASFAVVGCGGGEADDPLAGDNPVGDLTGNDRDKKDATARAIANLVGGLMAQLTDGTSSVFETFDVLSSEETAIGKVLGGVNNNPTGAKSTDIKASCSGSADTAAAPGEFVMDILLAPVIDGEIDGSLTPELDDIFKTMTTDDLAISLNLTFDNCDEPKHKYDGDNSTSPTKDQPMRLLDGNVNVNLGSTTDRGDDSNTDDFKLEGTVEMDNYFVQTDSAVKPDYASGSIAVTLVTDNANTGPFRTDLDISLTTNDGAGGGRIETDVNLKGTLDMDSEFSISGYNMSVSGSLLSSLPDSKGSYSIASLVNIGLSNGDGEELIPTSGELAVSEVALLTQPDGTKKPYNYTHFATITSTGITFDVQQDPENNREESSCTWDQIEEKDGQKCEI